MRAWKTILFIMCICMIGLTACGERTDVNGEADKAAVSTISVKKDGSISSIIIENFIESYYSEDDLKSMFESSIDKYKAANAAAQIELKSFKVQDGVTNICMEYGDYQTYAGFDREDFFAGTIKDANMAGFDLNVTLKSVSDNTTVSKPELLEMGDRHIVILGTEQPEDGQEAETMRVNCFDEILYVGDGVTVVGGKSADVNYPGGYGIIVFK